MATLRGLSNFSATSPSGRGANALGIALNESRFLTWLEGVSGWELAGVRSAFSPVESAITGTTRGLGANFSRTTIAPGNDTSITLAIYGDAVNWDVAYTDDVQRGLQNTTVWFNKEIVRRFRNVVKTLEAAMFNGDGTLPQMRGLKTMATALPGFSGSVNNRVMDAAVGGGDSLDISTAQGLLKLPEILDEAVALVPNANGIIVPQRLWSRISTLGRSIAGMGETRDQFGVPYVTWNTIPLVPVLDGTITYNEPDNAGSPATNTTSLYVLRAGEGLTSFVSNSGLYYRDGTVAGTEKTEEQFEFRLNTKCEEPDSILRVRNIKL